MKNKKKQAQRVTVGMMSMAMAMSAVCVPAMAAEDMTEPNPVVEEHPEDTMSPTKIVTPIGKSTFYKIDGDRVAYANRDDGSVGSDGKRMWNAVPSAYIKDSEYNKGNVEYGMYVAGGKVHFVELSACHNDGAGNYTWYHGSADSATVSSDVDTANNDDPTMGTQFYLNIENGIDPDGTTTTETGNAGTDDARVDYDISVTTKSSYQLNTTVPMYVCMYGYRGDGNVITPSKDAYQLKNYSTEQKADGATVTGIVKNTHYAKIYDENHSDEKLFSIAYDADTKKYTYWYSDPASENGWIEPANYHVMTPEENINASGQVYVIFIDGQWDFKAAGVLNGDTLQETVAKVDENHPLAADFELNGYNFGKTPKVGDKNVDGDTKKTGLAVKISEIQAEPATWKLVKDTQSGNLKRGELVMSLAPSKAIKDASAIDLSTVSASTDITERGWFMDAPVVDVNGNVTTPTELPMITNAKMAGGNVNAAGCTSVVKVTYTVTPLLGIADGETNSNGADAVDHDTVAP